MAQATLLEMAREVHLYSGEICPIPLAKRWVRDRYRKVCEKNIWSFKLGRSMFSTTAVYSTGSIALTNGSSTIVGTGTTWVASHVGQQIKFNGYVFTVITVTDTTHLTISLDGTNATLWAGSTSTGNTYSILQAYITPTPTDFHAFYSIIDPTNSWRLRLGYNVQELDRIDARRSASGTPYIVANGIYNSSNVPVFELWPHANSQKEYIYLYEKRVADLSDDSTPPPIIRSDILVAGALADLARWPGTPEQKNPHFDLYFTQWKTREAEFAAELEKAMVEDNSIMMNDLRYGSSLGYYPLDANFLQSHAF
jgi:hypothetical protein